MFSQNIHHPNSAICNQGSYKFANSVEEQIERFASIREHIVSEAATWLAQFTTIEFVLDSLKTDGFGKLRLGHYANKGSPSHLVDIAALEAFADGSASRQT